MSLSLSLMSPQARAFIKIYTATLKYEYELFTSTLNLMSTASLGIKCPVKAAYIAKELQGLHAEFDAALACLANRHELRHKQPEVEHPTVAELVKIVQISFFKLVKPNKLNQPSEDKGWFSGHPLEWEKAWKTLPSNLPLPALENAMTALFNALHKLLDKDHYLDADFPYKKQTPWNVDDEIDDEYYGDYEDDEDFPPSY